jgi:hypothetical protein
MELNVPLYVSLIFIVTTFITIYLIYKASDNSVYFINKVSNSSNVWLMVLAGWVIIQGIAGITGFYTISNTVPPRFALLAPPMMIVIAVLFILPTGRHFIDGFNLRTLTWIHTIRILVEICLWLLYKNGAVPKQMTFEGGNLDIVIGITAPLVAYTSFKNNKIKRGFLLLWNWVGLFSLLKIVAIAVLSVPTPFQKFGFHHPDIAVLYFPFVWLPCLIVPVVLFAHVAAIRKLVIIGKIA